MTTTVATAAFIALALLCTVLLKAYGQIPFKELRRRARTGDKTAASLHKAAAYGPNLKLFLWSLLGLFSAAGFVLIASHTSPLVGTLGIAALLWLVFGWQMNSRASAFGNWLAGLVSFPLAWVLSHLGPLLSAPARFLSKHLHRQAPYGVYEKEDLIELISRQKKLTHNRIGKEELSIAASALKFGDKLVGNVLVPRRVVKTVSANDPVGPVLLDELHKSGHSRFPVYEGKKDNLVGMLYVRDLVEARSGGQVKNFMKKELYYVKEDQPLGHALDAFIKTKHHMFIVVNNFEEMVGIITMEDVLEQILGKPILDEFDQYEDLRAVAAIGAEKDAEKHEEVAEVVESSEQPKEPKD